MLVLCSSCANLFKSSGVRSENIVMCDSKGVIYKGRKYDQFKSAHALDTKLRTLDEALKGADDGLSAKDVKNMVKSMAKIL